MGPDQYAQVIDLAKKAGQVILEHFGQPVGVQQKADNSPVTAADLAADRCITQGLVGLFGEHTRIVSEESNHGGANPNGQDSDEFWLIDPLDGTKSFIAGSAEFTVNIALIRQGRPIWGVIDAPALGKTWWGGLQQGAFEDAQAVNAVAPASPLRVLASKNHLTPATQQFLNGLESHQKVQSGSSLKFCEIASGRADLYPRMGPCCEWDTGAGEAILIGAGGSVCDLQGQPLRYGKADTLNPFFIASGQADPRDYLP